MNNGPSSPPIPGRPVLPKRPGEALIGAEVRRPETSPARDAESPASRLPEAPPPPSSRVDGAPSAPPSGVGGEVMYNRVNRAHQVPSTQTNSPTGPKENHMEKLPQNIQEAFLNAARKERTFLTIYLMSGVKLSGRIRSFDKYSVVLESNNQEQLIFKHAISTVVVAKPAHHTAGAHHSGSQPGVPGQAVGVANAEAGEN